MLLLLLLHISADGRELKQAESFEYGSRFQQLSWWRDSNKWANFLVQQKCWSAAPTAKIITHKCSTSTSCVWLWEMDINISNHEYRVRYKWLKWEFWRWSKVSPEKTGCVMKISEKNSECKVFQTIHRTISTALVWTYEENGRTAQRWLQWTQQTIRPHGRTTLDR